MKPTYIGKRISTFTDCLEITDNIRNKIQEHFGVILLDGSHQVIGRKILFKGGLNSTIVDPRIIFHYALKNLACAMIIYHNHPSGSPEPSKYDIELTKKLNEAGKIVGVRLLDHLIVPKRSFNELYSFKAETDIFND